MLVAVVVVVVVVDFVVIVTMVTEPMNSMRLQEQVRDSRRMLDRERSARVSAENRRKNLEKERSELIQYVITCLQSG